MSDQPKPATDHLEIDAELAEGVAKRQAKPTTGEWTAERIMSYFDAGQRMGSYTQRMQFVSDDINAALDAEREKSKGIGMVHDAVIESQFQQLREQLATAVEALKVIEIGHGVDARTARAALAKVKEGKS